MTISFICGFEAGDASEINSLAAGASVQGTTVRTGAYALQAGASLSTIVTGLSTTQSAIRFYLNAAALPAGLHNIFAENSNTTERLQVRFNTNGTLRLGNSGGQLGMTATDGTTVLSINTWYRVEVALDLAASGIVKLWVDGVLDINLTHTTDVTATVTSSWSATGQVTNPLYFDDIRIDTGTLTPPGSGKIIARQGKAGTPTYDAWTKNGAATAALCWSDTPFSTATNCSDTVINDAQTMLVEKFSITQTGHGTEVIAAIDTINACKVAMIAKTAIAGNVNLRRRVGGADTDTVIALTTSDKYWDSGIFTDSAANLDAYEIGAKSDLATLTTIEDMWLIVDFTAAIQGPLFAAEWRVPPDRRYPVENRGFVHQFDVSLLQGKDKFYGPIGMAVPVLDWEVPPPLRRSRALMDPQSQYVRVVGQESGFTKFVPDLTIPPPVRRQRTLDNPQAQYMRVVGQETLPGFTQEWKVPPPKVVPMENKGFIKDLDVHLIGQDQTPGFVPEWKVPPPVKRLATLVETDAPAHPLWLRIGSETLPGFNAEWKVPPPVKRQATVIDPQNQYPRIVGQETIPGFVPEQRVVPPPPKRVSTLGEPQSQYVRVVGQETVPGFVPDQRVVPPPAKRAPTIGEVQSQYVRVVGQETIPGFNAEWKVPPPTKKVSTLGEVQSQYNRVVGQETLPGFNQEWKVPPPVKRVSTLVDAQSQYVRIVGQETLPKSNLDWKIPAPKKTPMEVLWIPTRAILSGSFTQAVSAASALVGSATRAISKSNTATIPVLGTVIRAATKAVSGLVALVGTVIDHSIYHTAVSAVVGTVGSVLFGVGVILTTTIRAIGTVFFWIAEKTISTIWTDEPGDEG